MVTGFAAGYYLGAKAGRPRYDEINRSLSKLRGSDALETVADRARTVVEDGVDKARAVVDARAADGQNGYVGSPTGGPGESGLIIPGQPESPG